MRRTITTAHAVLVVALISYFAVASPSRGGGSHGRYVARRSFGFSGATLSILEDYRRTIWPVANRTMILSAPSGKSVQRRIANGSGGDRTELALYVRKQVLVNDLGRAVDGRFLLIGAGDCVALDPEFLLLASCRHVPPVVLGLGRPGLTYLGRFTWANGFDPPHGFFRYGWRFLPAEDNGSQDVVASQRR